MNGAQKFSNLLMPIHEGPASRHHPSCVVVREGVLPLSVIGFRLAKVTRRGDQEKDEEKNEGNI